MIRKAVCEHRSIHGECGLSDTNTLCAHQETDEEGFPFCGNDDVLPSRVFKPYELREIKRRQSGDFRDRNGTFASRVKPKIQELLQVWFPKKRELERLLKGKKRLDASPGKPGGDA